MTLLLEALIFNPVGRLEAEPRGCGNSSGAEARVCVHSLWNNPIPAEVAQRLQSLEPRLDFAFFDQQSQAL